MIESVPPAVVDEVASMGFRADGGGWRIGWHTTETPLDLVAAGREIAEMQTTLRELCRATELFISRLPEGEHGGLGDLRFYLRAARQVAP